MATIHFSEIQRILANQGEKQAFPDPLEGFFVEIRFDGPRKVATKVDEEFKDKVLTVDCAYGTATIQFDEYGQLKSIDIS